MNVFRGILLKVISALLFSVMHTLVRALGEQFPVGQIVFFRSLFAIVPVVVIYAYRRELRAAVTTKRPGSHVVRGLIGLAGMFTNFAALARLPLADAVAIGFAAPLITVALAAIFLGEKVRAYRWSAVAIGFVGVIIMLIPHMDADRLFAMSSTAAVGAMFALTSAFCSAGSVIQTRRLTGTETNSAIVFYFSVIAAIGGLCTLPFGWVTPTPLELAGLIAIGVLGGVSHLVLTESYRLAPASVVAPFDYTAIIWAVILGFVLFGEVPLPLVFLGAAIVTAAGLFVIWRERRLGLERARSGAGPTLGNG